MSTEGGGAAVIDLPDSVVGHGGRSSGSFSSHPATNADEEDDDDAGLRDLLSRLAVAHSSSTSPTRSQTPLLAIAIPQASTLYSGSERNGGALGSTASNNSTRVSSRGRSGPPNRLMSQTYHGSSDSDGLASEISLNDKSNNCVDGLLGTILHISHDPTAAPRGRATHTEPPAPCSPSMTQDSRELEALLQMLERESGSDVDECDARCEASTASALVVASDSMEPSHAEPTLRREFAALRTELEQTRRNTDTQDALERDMDRQIREIRVTLLQQKEAEIASLRKEMIDQRHALEAEYSARLSQQHAALRPQLSTLTPVVSMPRISVTSSAPPRPMTPLPKTPTQADMSLIDHGKHECELRRLRTMLLQVHEEAAAARAERDGAVAALEEARAKFTTELNTALDAAVAEKARVRSDLETLHRRELGEFRDRCHEAYRVHLDEFARAAHPLVAERARLEGDLLTVRAELARTRASHTTARERLRQSFIAALRRMKEDIILSKQRNTQRLEEEWRRRRTKYDEYWRAKIKKMQGTEGLCRKCANEAVAQSVPAVGSCDDET